MAKLSDEIYWLQDDPVSGNPISIEPCYENSEIALIIHELDEEGMCITIDYFELKEIMRRMDLEM